MRKDYKTSDLRNVCIAGSNSTGKTSLSEAILYQTDVITRLGSVPEGNTVCDYNKDEIERSISINLAVVCLEYRDKKINLIDMPGYSDFIGEVMSGIRVVEGAVFVISADTGIDAMAEDVWENLSRQKKPTLIFINKLDKENIDFENILAGIESKLGIKTTLVTYPARTGAEIDSYVDLIKMKKITVSTSTKDKTVEESPVEKNTNIDRYRDKLIDSIASVDDTLTEKYLEGREINENELVKGLKTGFSEMKLLPVMCGAGTRSVGITSLLDFIAEYFPPPVLMSQQNNKSAGLVFKTVNEPGMGQMNFVRVFSGQLNSGMDMYNVTRQVRERTGQLCFLQGKKRIETQSIIAGDMGAMIKLKETKTNDIVAEGKMDTQELKDFQPVNFPKTVLDMAVYSKSKSEEDKVGNALAAIVLEDQTIKFNYNPDTKEMIVSGMGNLQLEVMLSRIKSRYGVDIELRQARIPYKETVRGTAEVQGKYKRQSGGRGQYGDCWLRIEAQERGKGYEFVDKIFGGAIPKNYVPSVEKGVVGAMAEGVIAGYPLTDIRVTVFDGSYHEVDSSDMAFKIAAAMALRKGVTSAKPCVIEPIMNVEVVVPEEYLGSIMGDLNSRRGRVLGMDKVGKKNLVKAQVPAGEISNYAIDLRSITRGYGKFSVSFSHYEELPQNIAQTLIEKHQKSGQE